MKKIIIDQTQRFTDGDIVRVNATKGMHSVVIVEAKVTECVKIPEGFLYKFCYQSPDNGSCMHGIGTGKAIIAR